MERVRDGVSALRKQVRKVDCLARLHPHPLLVMKLSDACRVRNADAMHARTAVCSNRLISRREPRTMGI